MGQAAVPSEKFVAPSEAARRLGVSSTRVRQLIEEGRLGAVRTPLGRLLRVEAVEAELRRRRELGGVAG